MKIGWTNILIATVAILIFFAVAGNCWGQTGPAVPIPRLEHLTLEHAVQLALDQNPMVGATREAALGAVAQFDEAKSARFPFLQFGQKYTHGNNPVYVFGSLLEQGRFTAENFALDNLNNPASYSNFRSSLNLQIPIFNRFRVKSQIEQARLGAESADSDTRMVEQQIRFSVIQAYYGILVAEARRAAAEQAVETAQAERQRISDLVEQGIVVTSDLLATEVQLADFQREAIQSSGEVTNAYAALNAVLGRPVNAETSIAGELRDLDFGELSTNQLVQDALVSRPDYEQTQRAIEIHAQDLRAAKAHVYPDFNLFAQYGYSAQKFVDGSADFAVGANLTFNILDFGRTARVRQAHSGWKAAQHQNQQKANEISLEVVQAHSAYRAAKQRLAVAATAVSQASEALRIVQDRHGEGLTTISEVLNAQTALLRAKMNLLAARYDYYLGFAHTRLASGKLEDVTPFTS